MARVLMILPPVLFAGLATLFVFGMNRGDPDALPSAIVGREAPAVAVAAMAGLPTFDNAALRTPGVKLLNFWASWCAPCRAEHGVLEGLAAEGVPIYGVNYKDSGDNAAAYLAELGNPYRAIGADGGPMALDWGVYGVPETYLIDGEGRVVLRFAGPLTKRDIEGTLRPAMETAAK